MSNDTLSSLLAEVTKLEEKISVLDEHLQALTSEKAASAHDLAAIRGAIAYFEKSLPRESAITESSNHTSILNAGFTVDAAAFVILQSNNEGMSNKELVQALADCGRPIAGLHATTILGTALKSKPDKFQKIGERWYLKTSQQEGLSS